ncbi:Barwin-like endoglucanase [Glarea lozoyensis ATCC 20868]|uniref:Barwin-like endoglucanase n=1 Tax=Glarea lozoyensis (strain ATCC 20868 / MF5171) TaxID=1116229 RepID=S3CYI0_GLAL2|nr:Barwin-like endoglucanase [Glarea lozoyensis ATCC 20868]EPE30660.1 Barwin-like endoglucanase [Glarea lozoyensis ATCC 20868]
MQFQLSTLLMALATSVIAAPNPVTETGLSKRVDHFGLATVYTQNGGTGSCGKKNSDSAHIVALSNYWQKNQSPGPYCGRKVQVTNTGSNDGVGGKGNTIIATVADTCPGCDENHIDFSVGSWNQLTNNAAFGTANIKWHFCNANGQC